MRAQYVDRNSFINSAAASVIGIVVGSEPVWADEEVPGDLSMPSPEEQKAKEEADMAERLKRKAELQKKASKPTSYKSSFEAEQGKQQSMKKTKQELRDSMCEELGRGC